jgi:hypothetical protein
MTSYEMSFQVNDRIQDRLREAENNRLARLISGESRPKPPRGPLTLGLVRLAGVARMVARLANAS